MLRPHLGSTIYWLVLLVNNGEFDVHTRDSHSKNAWAFHTHSSMTLHKFSMSNYPAYACLKALSRLNFKDGCQMPLSMLINIIIVFSRLIDFFFRWTGILKTIYFLDLYRWSCWVFPISSKSLLLTWQCFFFTVP